MTASEALRCVKTCSKYFREKDESPLAASDLEEAYVVLTDAARLVGHQEALDAANKVVDATVMTTQDVIDLAARIITEIQCLN